ncbi:hypothetical protein [Paraburkholderia bonniea]|uniref:hypothetical protein n=1 Tax=Paraburkholderia bonniea TaxID=2152891 RepID=UPI00129250AA|nr:hypothetical protein [Paraburkholderia bonniea]
MILLKNFTLRNLTQIFESNTLTKYSSKTDKSQQGAALNTRVKETQPLETNTIRLKIFSLDSSGDLPEFRANSSPAKERALEFIENTPPLLQDLTWKSASQIADNFLQFRFPPLFEARKGKNSFSPDKYCAVIEQANIKMIEHYLKGLSGHLVNDYLSHEIQEVHSAFIPSRNNSNQECRKLQLISGTYKLYVFLQNLKNKLGTHPEKVIIDFLPSHQRDSGTLHKIRDEIEKIIKRTLSNVAEVHDAEQCDNTPILIAQTKFNHPQALLYSHLTNLAKNTPEKLNLGLLYFYKEQIDSCIYLVEKPHVSTGEFKQQIRSAFDAIESRSEKLDLASHNMLTAMFLEIYVISRTFQKQIHFSNPKEFIQRLQNPVLQPEALRQAVRPASGMSIEMGSASLPD